MSKTESTGTLYHIQWWQREKFGKGRVEPGKWKAHRHTGYYHADKGETEKAYADFEAEKENLGSRSPDKPYDTLRVELVKHHLDEDNKARVDVVESHSI
jgi:hypothetical protein